MKELYVLVKETLLAGREYFNSVDNKEENLEAFMGCLTKLRGHNEKVWYFMDNCPAFYMTNKYIPWGMSAGSVLMIIDWMCGTVLFKIWSEESDWWD